ncbi:PLP-dependent transferase [Cupriavidus basilensis]
MARHLKASPKVEWVNFAGLPEHPDHALVQRYLGGRGPGILSFGLKSGGREAGARFLDALQLFTRLVNIGDAKSLATHPASTTHRQLDSGGTEGRRCQRRHGAAVDRHRAYRRSAGRPGAGAGCGLSPAWVAPRRGAGKRPAAWCHRPCLFLPPGFRALVLMSLRKPRRLLPALPLPRRPE